MNWCFIGYGLGGKLTSGGIVELQGIIKGKYPQMNVQTFRGERAEAMAQMILEQVRPGDKLILGGYSWSADNVPAIAKNCGHQVGFLFALQPSIWYPSEPITPNVKEALCVYNPWWFETGGLGFRELTLAPGNTTTKLTIQKTHDSHPYVQYDPIYRKMIFDGIDRTIGA